MMATMNEDDTLLKVSEVAAQLRVAPATVLNWIRDRKLSAIRVGSTYRVRAGALREFLNEGDTSREGG